MAKLAPATLANVKEELLANAFAIVVDNVPPLTVVGPVYVLTTGMTNIPGPSMVNPPTPSIILLAVVVIPVLVVTVAVLFKRIPRLLLKLRLAVTNKFPPPKVIEPGVIAPGTLPKLRSASTDIVPPLINVVPV